MNARGPATTFPELNSLLEELTERTQAILGANFVGAYLQGSFALGDADMSSDCDFLIPVRTPLTKTQESALRALHDEIPTRQEHWTHHLEGSYPVAEELHTLASLGREWLYVDHGWRQMQWSTHCNSAVARWTLRQHGVVLAGPDPETLVDEVTAGDLRSAMCEALPRFLDDFATWMSLDVAWGQRYAVTTYARMLATLDTGEVLSKRQALLWASDALDSDWADLLAQVMQDRFRGYVAGEPARPGSAARTLAFSEYAERRAKLWCPHDGDSANSPIGCTTCGFD